MWEFAVPAHPDCLSHRTVDLWIDPFCSSKSIFIQWEEREMKARHSAVFKEDSGLKLLSELARPGT